MASEQSEAIERVRRDPEFQRLVRSRSRFAWTLSALMALIYFGFVLLVAFAPQWLATPLGEGVTTIGIPLGLGVILSAFVLTGVYVRRANTLYDAAIERIRARVT
jgi:uncharacterized membrane protein (DUF485 family)